MSAHELFAKYLDLTPLRGKTRGLVRCIFHAPDCTPSLSVNLELAIFYCFGCGVRGGVRKFAALVDETLAANPLSRPRRPCSPQEEARAAVLRAARRHRWAWRLTRITTDGRRRQRAVDHARCVATAAGPTGRSWDILAGAAAAERTLRVLEPLFDEVWELVTRAPADDRDLLLDVLERGFQ